MTETVKTPDQGLLVELTSDIVSAYVGNHVVPASDLAGLIAEVFNALSNTSSPAPVAAAVEKPKPAVSVRRSVQDDQITCLECGGSFKSLKRHLRTKYGMSPEDYRAKWGLPKDYPMVAPNYAKARSDLAKQMGLGQGGRQVTRKPRAKA